jgi:hypothetical protein
LATAIAPAAHADDNPSLGTWFARNKSVCDTTTGTCSSTTLYLSKLKPHGDVDGLGNVGPSILLNSALWAPFAGPTTVGTQDYDHPAEAAVRHDIPAGTPVAGAIFVQTYEPESLSATVSLNSLAKSGAAPVQAGAGSTSSAIYLGLADSGYAKLAFTFKTTKPIKAGQLLDFDFKMNTLGTSFVGYGTGHATYLKLG